MPGIEGLQCSDSLGIHRTTNARYFYRVWGRSEQLAGVSGCSVLGVGWVVWLRWLSHARRRATGLSGQRSAASGSGLKVVPLHIFARAAAPAAHQRMAVSTRMVLDGGWVAVVSDSAWHSAIQATPSCRLQLQVFERGSNWKLQLSSDTLEYCLYNNVFILK